MPTISSIELPKVELPKLEIPTVQFPDFDRTKVIEVARDVAYVVVGATALAIEKIEEARKDVTGQVISLLEERRSQVNTYLEDARTQLNDYLAQNRSQLEELGTTVRQSWTELEGRYDEAVEALGERLPEPAAKVLGQVHDAAKTARQQVREAVTAPAA